MEVVKRAAFPERYTEANNQQAQYDEKSPEEKAANKKYVIKLIGKWIESSGLGDIVSQPVEINLSELNELVIKREIKRDKADEVANTNKEVEKIERKIWKKAFGKDSDSEQPLSKIRDDTKHYLWVSFRADGMVVTVGKTNVRNGDLLKYEDLYSSGTGDTRIILQQLLSPDDKKVLDDLSIKMHRYVDFALVMGINVNLNDGNNDEIYEVQGGKGNETRTKIQLENQTNRKLSSSVIKLENQLGEYLIEEGINILNRYSHCPKKAHITEK